MQIDRLEIPDVMLLTPRRFGDPRGYFAETFNARVFGEKVAALAFVQDNEALSAETGTLRGLLIASSCMDGLRNGVRCTCPSQSYNSRWN